MKQALINIIKNNNTQPFGLLIKEDISTYVKKIYDRSKIISIYEDGKICAFISYYKNDIKNKTAFLTLILVDKDFKSKGTGQMLLKMAIKDLIINKFVNFQLEVYKNNELAKSFYMKNGFQVIKDQKETYIMELNLQNQSLIKSNVKR